MKQFAAVFALFLATGACAHEGDAPPSSTPDEDAGKMQCLIVGAREAWGAASRFAGAPYKFERTSEDNLKKLFWAIDTATDVPAIFTLEFDNPTDQRFYEEAATAGWRQANAWIKEGKDRPSYEVLLAVFYNGCKESQK